jgi:DNA-binding NarL/FixJ family response regulator
MDRANLAVPRELSWIKSGDGHRGGPFPGGAPPAPGRGEPTPPLRLTRREAEVLNLLAWRWTDKEIAVALGISPRTAMGHVAAVLAKLGARNRREVAAVAGRLLA